MIPEEHPHRRRRRPPRRALLSPRTCISRRTRASPSPPKPIKTRDLEAIVSASGKIQAERLVNISADTPGRVVNLAVNEGDRDQEGTVPAADRPEVAAHARRQRRGVAAGRRERRSSRCGRRSKRRARSSSRRGRTSRGSRTSGASSSTTREALDKAMNDVEGRPSRRCRSARRRPTRRPSRIAQERADLESARYDLSKVRIESPIDGIVTRRNIQEGETAVVGTMNNAGTVLLTLADMSVDPGRSRSGRDQHPERAARTEGEDHDRRDPRQDRSRATSPKSATARFRRPPRPGTATQATNFKVDRGPRRSGARRAARLHLHRRHHDGDAQERRRRCRFRRSPCASWCTTRTARSSSRRTADKRRQHARIRRPRLPELKPGQTRKETEGVFVVRDKHGRVRADQDGHRRRQVLRGAVGPEGGRSGRSPGRTTRCAAWLTATW